MGPEASFYKVRGQASHRSVDGVKWRCMQVLKAICSCVRVPIALQTVAAAQRLQQGVFVVIFWLVEERQQLTTPFPALTSHTPCAQRWQGVAQARL